MSSARQILAGFFMALLFCLILLGSISLSLAESGVAVAQQAPSATPTLPALYGSPPPTIINVLVPGSSSLTPAASATPTYPTSTSCPPPSGWIGVEVLPGDTLLSVAESYQADPDKLAIGNCLLANSNSLSPGSLIYVPEGQPPTSTRRPTRAPTRTPIPPPTYCSPPAGWVLYTIRSGDTLMQIGRNYGVSVQDLKAANCLASDKIIAGKTLFVPYRLPTALPSATRAPTLRPSVTPTPTPTRQPTGIMLSATPTPTPTPSFTIAPPGAGTSTTTPTSTATNTQAPTGTPTPTFTSPPPTPTPSWTPSRTPTWTSPPPTSTPVPTSTNTPTLSIPYP